MNRGLYLSLMIGGTKAEPVPQPVIEALTEVQVNASATSQSGFQLKFTLGKRSVIAQRLLPSGYFDPQRRVIVVATVKGTPHVLMDGVITKQDVAASSDAGESVLTITGLDISVHMDFVDLTGIPYPAMPPSAMVALILAKYAVFGVVPLVVPSLISQIENPLEKLKGHKGTDLAFVRSLATSVGHVFYIDPGPSPGTSTAYWGPEIRHGSAQPALTVNMDAASNVESLTFAYDGLASRQYVATILNEELKFPIPIPVPNVTLLKPTLARESAAIMKTQNIRVAKFKPAQAAQIALAAMAGSSDAVTGSGQLDVLRYGHVLKPRQLVAVRGAGDNFNGRYFVKNVTHNIKRGSYTQSFSLARGGIKSDISRVAS
jgi:hypothetical protein